METADNFEGSKIIDFFAFLLHDFYMYCYSIACASNQLVRRLLENIQLSGFLDSVNDKLENHPILKFAVFGSIASFAVPIVLYIAFAMASLVITFAGFVLIEGIILTAGGLCMCVCLLSMAMVLSALAVILGILNTIATKLQILNKS